MNSGKETLVRQQAGSRFLGGIQLLDEGQQQFYSVHAPHGYWLVSVETFLPGTTNINLQGFVFVVPGFLFGFDKYALFRCKSLKEASKKEGVLSQAPKRLNWLPFSTRSTSRRNPRSEHNSMATNCDTLLIVNVNGGLCSESHGVAQGLPFRFRRKRP
jgi:hypothetical protein